MILDLKTGETYPWVLYADSRDVILLGAHGEAHMTTGQFGEAITWPAGAPGWAVMRRYQVLEGTAQIPGSAIADRIQQLKDYAAGNGGQIGVHLADPEPTGLAGAAKRARAFVRGIW